MQVTRKIFIILRNEHSLFCPVYVLDRKNHSGRGTPKWHPKSQVGIYCDHSPQHASDLALIINLQTGHGTPQFYVIFDDGFATASYLTKE